MELVIAVLFVLAIPFFIRRYSPVKKGLYAEREVARILSYLPQEEYVVLNDITLQSKNYTSQIDHIIVSLYGVFVLETKNYAGWIYGYENAKTWTQNIFGNKYALYNPIKQNKSHILTLKKRLGIPECDFVSVVVFSDKCTLKTETETPVVYISELFDTIASYRQKRYDKAQLLQMTQQILSGNMTSSEQKKQHICNIKHKKKAEKDYLQLGLCPKCKAPLVLRTGCYGAFYGCSNYPKCRYTHPCQ